MPAASFRVVLISTYELGHQPFGLASPAAWLRGDGFDVVTCDISVEPLPRPSVLEADLVAFYVPMHTAARLAVQLTARIQSLNPGAALAYFGLYAPMNESLFRRLGASAVLGGEFESGLRELCRRLRTTRSAVPDDQQEPLISTDRLDFLVPDRNGLPDLTAYAYLLDEAGNRKTVGYVEASRGCKHKCRHCPIVPVYDGRFRVLPHDVVIADIRQQVEAGANHITFGDPDFFNGIGHAIPVMESFGREFPGLTYDVTIKVEHLLKHADLLPVLKKTGCLMVTSAVESFDDRVLKIFDKGHSREDFFRVVKLFDESGLVLNPTFVSFTPWTTTTSYLELLDILDNLDLVAHVSPVQLAIRLLIPAGSKLLDLPEVQALAGPFSEELMMHEWHFQDATVESLFKTVRKVVGTGTIRQQSRIQIFSDVWEAAKWSTGSTGLRNPRLISRSSIPYLTEPWYC